MISVMLVSVYETLVPNASANNTCSDEPALTLLTHLQFLNLKWGRIGSYESTLVKMPYSWKSHVAAQLCYFTILIKYISNI